LVRGCLCPLPSHLPIVSAAFEIASVSLHIPRSVISANVKLALRCRSTLSEYTSVLNALKGSPEKKSVSPRCDEVRSILCHGRRAGDVRSRGIVASRRRLLVRCPRGRARRGYPWSDLRCRSENATTGIKVAITNLHKSCSMLRVRYPSRGSCTRAVKW
jgi:hypothetical protein